MPLWAHANPIRLNLGALCPRCSPKPHPCTHRLEPLYPQPQPPPCAHQTPPGRRWRTSGCRTWPSAWPCGSPTARWTRRTRTRVGGRAGEQGVKLGFQRGFRATHTTGGWYWRPGWAGRRGVWRAGRLAGVRLEQREAWSGRGRGLLHLQVAGGQAQQSGRPARRPYLPCPSTPLLASPPLPRAPACLCTPACRSGLEGRGH